METLAQIELTTMESLVRQGGPFAVAFGMLTICGLILWKYALQPAFTSLAQIQSDAAKSAAQHTIAASTNLQAAQSNEGAAVTAKQVAEINAKLMDRILDKLE